MYDSIEDRISACWFSDQFMPLCNRVLSCDHGWTWYCLGAIEVTSLFLPIKTGPVIP